MALEGSIKTPFGQVSKKTALLVGGGAVVIAGVVWYRGRNAAASTPTTDSTDATTGEIDPATGYVYGTPEDAAALEAQSQYVDPTSLQGVATSGSTQVPSTTYTSNSQWVQGVVSYMVGNSLVSDGGVALCPALGKYITGPPVPPAQVSLIEQAIAVQDYPPIAGTDGYPPSYRTATTTTAPSTISANADSIKIINLKMITSRNDRIGMSWGAVGRPDSYRMFLLVNGSPQLKSNVTGTSGEVTGLKSNTSYTIGVAPVRNGVQGPIVYATGRTSK